MKIQNPFSLYDFMGYFIPGSLLIYLYLFISDIEKLGKNFKIDAFLKSNKDFQLDELLFFVIISYALGHLVNFISSITIEKFAIWMYGYTSKYLLGFHNKKYWGKNNCTGYFLRIILPIVIFPVATLDYFFGVLLRFKDLYTKELDLLLIDIINEKGLILIKKLYKTSATEINLSEFDDFFRIFAHYTFENSKQHQIKLINYVVLYGFLRVLTFISVVAFWFSIYNQLFTDSKLITPITTITISIISYVFYMAFMKFYRRYTLEGLMLIAVDTSLE